MLLQVISHSQNHSSNDSDYVHLMIKYDLILHKTLKDVNISDGKIEKVETVYLCLRFEGCNDVTGCCSL